MFVMPDLIRHPEPLAAPPYGIVVRPGPRSKSGVTGGWHKAWVDIPIYFDNPRNMEKNRSASVVDALAALAQEHRLAVFRALVQAGPEGMAAGRIAEKLGLPNSSLSFHLAQLRHAGLVSQKREGRSLIYAADYGAMNALVGYLMENCCGGADCAEQLSESLEQLERKCA